MLTPPIARGEYEAGPLLRPGFWRARLKLWSHPGVSEPRSAPSPRIPLTAAAQPEIAVGRSAIVSLLGPPEVRVTAALVDVDAYREAAAVAAAAAEAFKAAIAARLAEEGAEASAEAERPRAPSRPQSGSAAPAAGRPPSAAAGAPPPPPPEPVPVVQGPPTSLQGSQGGPAMQPASLCFAQREGTQHTVRAIFPRPGNYVLRIFADGEWALDYRVVASGAVGAPFAFPEATTR